jgi:hypothetical protein
MTGKPTVVAAAMPAVAAVSALAATPDPRMPMVRFLQP